MTTPPHGERTALGGDGLRAILRAVAGATMLAFLVIAAGEPSTGSVLGLGAATLAYVIASFGAEAG